MNHSITSRYYKHQSSRHRSIRLYELIVPVVANWLVTSLPDGEMTKKYSDTDSESVTQ